MRIPQSFFILAALATACSNAAEPIGEVDTVFKLIGPDHKIVVEAYDDPEVEGVTCYVSRAKTGGIKGGLGLAEDKAEASIACRQVGPIRFAKPLKKQDEIFTERKNQLLRDLLVAQRNCTTRPAVKALAPLTQALRPLRNRHARPR